MKRTILLFSVVLYLLIPNNLFAQYVDGKLLQETEKLSMMTGEWEGSGWMMLQDGTKSEFDQTEKVYFKLSNTLLIIEGRGIDKESGSLIHDAYAVIKYQPEEDLYRFESFLSNGNGTITKGKLENEDTFVWWMDQASGSRIIYTIDFSEEGTWKETGEYLAAPEAENGRKFFEMTLRKVN
jgi:hypothetical protein